ncbi:MAG: pknD 3 [Paenibacillus sp.]|nr:pknD 3 [Paenibacillus sp.]
MTLDITLYAKWTAVSNADLSDLTFFLDDGGPFNIYFEPGKTSYALSNLYGVTSLLVEPVVADSRATVKVNGMAVASGSRSPVNLNVGSNTITVLVTAQDGTTKTYTLTMTRLFSIDSILNGLTISSGTVPEEDPTDYTKYFADVANSVSSITITPTARDSKSTVTVNGMVVVSGSASGAVNLDVGKNTITIIVTAEDGTTKNTYTLTVTRAELISGTYTVTFDTQGGSLVTSRYGVSSGATITAPADPTKSGYTFAGWYKEAAYVTLWNYGTDTVIANTTLYAKWTAIPSSGGGVPTPPNDSKVISKDGVISLPAGRIGEVHLDDEITIEIPANATEKDLKLTIEKVLETQSLLPNNEVLVSPIFEILKNFPENFNKPVKMTIVFEPASLKEGQIPSIFYFDEAMRKWVMVGGIVKGNRISVEVDHFTKYAVLAVDQPSEVKVSLNDISGHWAEAGIIQAVKDGIVEGYPDETFKPDHAVTRAEFAVMLMKALKRQDEGAALTFTDTMECPAWARKAVAQAVQIGIIKGYEDGTFRPNATITALRWQQ